MQVGKRHRAGPRPAEHLDLGIERDQRRSPVAGVERDAMVAYAEHGMTTVEPVEGRAPRPRRALVALVIASVPEVGAARTLQHITTKPGHVAQLLRRRLPQTFGQDRVIASHSRIGMKRRHRNQRADPQFVIRAVDAPHRRVVDRGNVDDRRWSHHVELHQVDQRRAAALVLHGRSDVRARGHGGERDGTGGVARHFIGKGAHQPCSIADLAWCTAATMLG